jgi:hypothetical protein
MCGAVRREHHHDAAPIIRAEHHRREPQIAAVDEDHPRACKHATPSTARAASPPRNPRRAEDGEMMATIAMAIPFEIAHH